MCFQRWQSPALKLTKRHETCERSVKGMVRQCWTCALYSWHSPTFSRILVARRKNRSILHPNGAAPRQRRPQPCEPQVGIWRESARWDVPITSWLVRNIDRNKFRSQTSDNMDRWKSRGGKSQGVEDKKWEDQRRERVRRNKMQVREKKVGKSRFTVFFQWHVAPERRNVGSLRRRVRSHLARWEIENCTLLWREAHFQVKMYKTLQLRNAFRSWDVEKVHAVVARSTFPSQNLQQNCQKWSEHIVLSTFWLGNVLPATTACTFSTSERPKVVRTCGVLCILTWTCASRHNGVYFFDISTSESGPGRSVFYTFDLEMCFAQQWSALFRHLNFKRGPRLVFFVDFDLEMCFALQWRALFRHLNFQKWSEHVVFVHFDLETCFAPKRRALFRHLNFWKWTRTSFLHFWLGNVLRGTMVPTFSTSQRAKVVRCHKCTPLWREAHLEVKSVKNWWFWAFSDVQMSKKCTLTSLTNFTNLTDQTYWTNSTNTTNKTSLTNLTN